MVSIRFALVLCFLAVQLRSLSEGFILDPTISPLRRTSTTHIESFMCTDDWTKEELVALEKRAKREREIITPRSKPLLAIEDPSNANLVVEMVRESSRNVFLIVIALNVMSICRTM